MVDENVLVALGEEGILQLTLNRPETLNALTYPMVEELQAALDRASWDPAVRCVLLTGAGRGFSSGADLGGTLNSATEPFDAGACLETHFNPLMKTIMDLPVPLVVAVNGPAAGAGSALAVAGDFVIASKAAYFIQSFVNIGLVPDAGSTWLLPRTIGRPRATALMMLGERLGADTAAEWGLVYKVVEGDKLIAEARTIALKLASGPTKAHALIRRAIHAGSRITFEETLALERSNQRIAGETRDFQEGMQAFAATRPPAFTGT